MPLRKEVSKAVSQVIKIGRQMFGVRIRITSGYRSSRKQASLYKRYVEGKSRYPVAPPGRSQHEYGLAVDLQTNPSNLHETVTVPLMESAGFYWGGDFSEPDKIHFQAIPPGTWANLIGATSQAIPSAQRPAPGAIEQLPAELPLHTIPAQTARGLAEQMGFSLNPVSGGPAVIPLSVPNSVTTFAPEAIIPVAAGPPPAESIPQALASQPQVNDAMLANVQARGPVYGGSGGFFQYVYSADRSYRTTYPVDPQGNITGAPFIESVVNPYSPEYIQSQIDLAKQQFLAANPTYKI